ncbi:hypothetical protein HN51_040188, partial [Arachis hypogaea]
ESNNIKPYLPDTKITGIQVGNEVYTDENPTMFQYLAPVVINIQNALSQLGISSNIQVSSPSSLAVLQESYTHSADNPNKIPLDYVLFNPSEGMVDPNKKLHYDNMLYAQVDAVAFAFAKLGFNDIGIK